MSENNNDNKKKTKRAININRVRVIGRVHKAPEKKKEGKYIRVSMLIPGYRKDNKMQWVPVSLDIFGEHRAKAAELTHGDFVRAEAFLIPKEATDDQGDKKKLLMLQHNAYEGLGVVKAEMDGMDPPDDGLCLNEVMIGGRFIARKNDRDKGQMTPILRGGDRKMAFLNIVYNDPRRKDEDDDAIWLDVGLFGPQAEIAAQYTRHNDQVFVVGEISKREAGFTVGGRAPAEIKISAKPYGFQFCTLGSAGGQKADPKGPDSGAYGEGGLTEDDLPF